MGVWEGAIGRIADPVMRDLAARGQVRSYPGGSLIIRESEAGDTPVYLILAGKVRVFVSDAQGREMVLNQYGPGDAFGEMALDGNARSASVLALESTVCSVVERQSLLAALRADPEIAMRMFALIIGRARSTTINCKDLALLDVYGRVAHLLRSLETATGADGIAWSREQITQQEIANRVGASRDMISRILKDLRTGGYIAVRDKRITILRRPPARW